MKCKKDTGIEYISFLLNDARRPGVVFDLNGTILCDNRTFREHWILKEIRDMKKLLIEQSTDLWNDIISCNFSGKRTCEIDLRFGEGQILSTHVDIIYFEQAKQVIALFDILDEEREVDRKIYLHAFHNTDCFMLVLDRKGIIRDINNQYTKFFNEKKEFFIGKKVEIALELFSNSRDMILAYLKEVRLYGYAEEVLKYEPTSDDERYYQVTTIHDRETDMYLIRMKNMTETVVLENRLVHNGSLSTIGELAASIAHEIRNPMTTLKGFVQLLQISASEDTLKYLAVIDDEISRMESILSEMLVLSKPTSNKKTSFSLEVLVSDMLQVIRPKAMMEGITLRQKETDLDDTLIIGDAEKIKQVLLNLFKNAMEAMSPGGTLTTALSLDSAGQFRLEIADTGKGMTLQQLNQVFMPFYTSKPEGTGLGLPFVLKTIEEHGGNVTVESFVDQGTVFIVTLPPAIARHPRKVTEERKLLLY